MDQGAYILSFFFYFVFFKVGAGLPVIASLNRIISSGDPVHRIIGSLSGMISLMDI